MAMTKLNTKVSYSPERVVLRMPHGAGRDLEDIGILSGQPEESTDADVETLSSYIKFTIDRGDVESLICDITATIDVIGERRRGERKYGPERDHREEFSEKARIESLEAARDALRPLLDGPDEDDEMTEREKRLRNKRPRLAEKLERVGEIRLGHGDNMVSVYKGSSYGEFRIEGPGVDTDDAPESWEPEEVLDAVDYAID